jgi:predicted transcriptional regulator
VCYVQVYIDDNFVKKYTKNMDFLVDKLRFLGLNEREVRVFTSLSTFGRMKMTKIASRAGVPRTTVDAIIRRLVEQGLVTQERIASHYEYSVDLDKVADTLDWIEKRLRIKDQGPGEIISDNIIDENIVIKDSKTHICTIETAFKERSGDRLRVLLARTPEGLEDALHRLTEYVRRAATTDTRMEILLCSQVADAIRSRGVQDVSWSDPNLIRLNVVPGSYCRTESDIFIFPDRVLLHNIRNDDIQCEWDVNVVEAMKHLLDIACETGWSVNLSAWLNNVVLDSRHTTEEAL